MKKLSFIVMAGLLVLGLTQCKKNEPTNTNNADNGNRVSITLKLENGGGQRVHPEEENGIANVVYDNGDVVLVGSAGKYMGSLTYNGTLFTGSINDAATVGEPLQFIFLGGQSISGLTENASTEYTFNIGDQSIDLAVISCAPSNEDFSATNLSYTAYLRNKCALVKFSLGETGTDAAISLTGVKTEATINFDGTVTNGTATGNIVTYGTGATRYAVVLSDQEAVTGGNISAEGYEGTFNIPTAAYTNAFLTNATITLTAPAAYRLLSEATAADCGKVVCADGHLHDAKTAVPDGCTAVGIVGKVTETGHGLILALQNANPQNWNTINGWTSTTDFAGTTLKVLPDGAHGGLTGYTTLGETAVSNWAVAQKSDYEAIFANLGSTNSDENGTQCDYNVNEYITTGVGGTAITSHCWTATEYDNGYAWRFFLCGLWWYTDKTYDLNVRPVLGFGGEAEEQGGAATAYTLAESTMGMVVGTDGLAYAAADKDNLPDGVSAAGMVAYKDGSNGLVIALADEVSTMDWSTACGASGAAAHTPIVTGQTWKLPSWEDWQHIRNAYGYNGTALNTAIENVGGTAIPTARFNPETESMTNIYWSSTEFADNTAQAHVSGINGGGEIFASEGDHDIKDASNSVRAVLAF